MLLAEIKIVIPYTPPKFNYKQFTEQVQPLAQKRFAQVFGGDVTVEIAVGAGSIVTLLAIIGTLTTIAAGASTVLANYTHARENVPVIWDDIKQAVAWLSVEMQDRAGGYPQHGTTVEIHAPVPTNLFAVARAIDQLSADLLQRAPTPQEAGARAAHLADQLMQLGELAPEQAEIDAMLGALRRNLDVLRQVSNTDPVYRDANVFGVVEKAVLTLPRELPAHPAAPHRILRL